MKTFYSLFSLCVLSAVILSLTSCQRTPDDLWEDTKSAGRHIGQGFNSLSGKRNQSRQVYSKNEFECLDEGDYCPTSHFQDYEYQDSFVEQMDDEFVPLQDQCNPILGMNGGIRPPSQTPGERGSFLPGIEHFQDPAISSQYCGIFRPIYFEYDCYMIRGETNVQSLNRIAQAMRANPNLYIFVEGHTDERGAQAYNQVLGSKRCNAVRNYLINEGVNSENIFTISYGKERPVILDSHSEAWARNRRAEFKIYEN